MRRPYLVGAVAATLAALLLGGCVAAKTPQAAVGERPAPPQRTDAVHLASLTILELNTDYGVALAVEPQTATFPAGETQFEVLNKWHGLSPGSHVERVRVLSEDGLRTLYQEETPFEVTPNHLTVTVMELVRLSGASAGIYWIAIDLDGAEVTRYTFQLVEVAPEGP